MARKSINFNVSEETYQLVKDIFPEVIGSDDNMRQLIDAFRFREQHLNDPAPDNTALEETQKQVAELTAQLEALQAENRSINDALTQQQDDNRRQQESIQHYAETLAERENRPITWDDIRPLLQPFTADLLDETAVRLREKYHREVTPLLILADMFLRYTIERNAEWFYPFVLRDADILRIARQHNENITSIAQIRKGLHL